MALFTLACAVDFVAIRAVPAECGLALPVVVVVPLAPAPAQNTRPKRIAPEIFNNPDTGDPSSGFECNRNAISTKIRLLVFYLTSKRRK